MRNHNVKLTAVNGQPDQWSTVDEYSVWRLTVNHTACFRTEAPSRLASGCRIILGDAKSLHNSRKLIARDRADRRRK